MNNLVVQLLLKTGTFSTDLKQAKGQVQDFQRGCQTAGKSISGFSQALGINVGALTKFGGAVGAAVLAGKALKGILESTQTTADAFDGAIAGCKGVVDALAVSIASADFSTFQNGLLGVFDAAKAARDALDDLQDAQLGYGMLSARNRREFTEAQTAYKEAKTPEEKESARQRMEQALLKEERESRNFETKNFNAIKAQIRNRNTNINEKDITPEMIYEVAEIFNSVNSDERRKQAKDAANTVKKEAKKYAADSKRDQYYQKHQRELIIDSLLEMGDKKIQAVAQELQAGENARTAAASMRKTYDRTTKGETKPTTPTRTSTKKAKEDELEIEKDSLTYWRNILAEETKYRDAVVKDTNEWKLHNDRVIEAQQHIDEINGKMNETRTAQEGSLAELNKILSEATKLRDETAYGTEDWKKFNQTVQMTQQLIDGIMREMEMDKILDDALKIDKSTISGLQQVASILTVLRNNAEIGSEEFEEINAELDKIMKKIAAATGGKTESETEEDKTKKKIGYLYSATSGMSSLTGSLNTITDGFMKLAGVEDDADNGFKKFVETLQTSIGILNAVASTMQTVVSMKELYKTASKEAAAEAVASDTLIASSAAATAGTEVAANTAAAASAGAKAVAGVPIVGPALAVAAVASIIAAIIAATNKAKAQKFANGGIVGGSSFTGDRISANVNSGEMILNKNQQARLFQLANGGGTTGKEVTFHISGTDLVGVLNNQTRKNRLIR